MNKSLKLLYSVIYSIIIALPLIVLLTGRIVESFAVILTALILFYWYKTQQLAGIVTLFKEKSHEMLWLSLFMFLLIAFFSLFYGYGAYTHFKGFAFFILAFFCSIVIGIFITQIKEKNFYTHFAYSLIISSLILVLIIVFYTQFSFISSTYKSLSYFNRYATAFSLWVIPFFYLCRNNRKMIIFLVFSALSLSYFSESGTAPFVLSVALIAFIFSYYLKKNAIIISAAIICLVILFLPYFATFPFKYLTSEFHQTFSGASTNHRSNLWNSYALLTQQHWFIGWGFDAARTASINPAIALQFKDPNFSLGAHPHMMPLEIYFEQGILAIFALLTTFYALIRKVLTLDRAKAALCFACFSGTFTLTMINFSIWQYWIVIIIGIQATFCVNLSMNAHTRG